MDNQFPRLTEIIERDQEYITGDNLTPEQHAAAMRKFEGATEIVSTQGGKLHLFVKEPHYILKLDDGTVCGWMSLDEGPEYFKLDIIYFFPRYRKGPYVPAFLHAVKSVLEKPIYFPPDSVLYRGGTKLLKALAKHAMATITVIHNDGSAEEFDQNTKLNDLDALLVERMIPLILTIPVDFFGTKGRAIVSVFEGDDIIGPADDKLI